MPAATAERPPVLLVATRDEREGALARVAGLTVVGRALAQLRRMGHPVIVASDGALPLPAPLPEGVTVRDIPPEGLEGLRDALGHPAEVRADVVRPASRELSGGLRVTDAASRRRAEDAVFAELLRGDLGLVARYLNKPVSFRITRWVLCRLPVTPNQVTLFAAVIGLGGCALVATGRPWALLVGLFLAHVQSVLDGCDGELARVRFQQSAIGEWLDTLVDDAMNLALLVALGVGVARAEGTGWPMVVGGAAAAMLLFHDLVVYRELRRQGEGGEALKVRWWFLRGAEMKSVSGEEKLSATRLLTAVGRRDFFVLAWFVLACAGQLRVVLVYALLVVLPSFVVAVGQVLFGPRARAAHAADVPPAPHDRALP